MRSAISSEVLQVLFVDDKDSVRARVAAGIFERVADWCVPACLACGSIRARGACSSIQDCLGRGKVGWRQADQLA